MKQFFLLLAIITSTASSTIAQNQKVVLCSDYDKANGKPIGINRDWDVKKDGGSFVYIIYSQDKPIVQSLILQVDKKNKAGNFVSYSTQKFDILPSVKKKWAMWDYRFTEEGDFRVSVLGKGNVSLAKTLTNIAYFAESSSTDTSSSNTNYYKKSLVAFGDSIIDGEIKGEAATFKLINGKRTIYSLVSNDKGFDTKQVTVYVYTGKDYKEKAYSEVFDIGELDWVWFKIPIDLTKKGKYVVDIYNDKDVYINSGYFEIN